MPACCASRSTASGKLTPSVSMRKSKMLPFLPEEKSNHIAFWSLTKNDGVFSLLKGDNPFHSRPALRNFTRRPTTSDTGSRARNSSRNASEKRIAVANPQLNTPAGQTLLRPNHPFPQRILYTFCSPLLTPKKRRLNQIDQ